MCCVLSVTGSRPISGVAGKTGGTGPARPIADSSEEKRMKTMLCAGVAAAALLVGSAAPSQAMLMLQVSDGAITLPTIQDLSDSGTVVFDSSIGGYSIN